MIPNRVSTHPQPHFQPSQLRCTRIIRTWRNGGNASSLSSIISSSQRPSAQPFKTHMSTPRTQKFALPHASGSDADFLLGLTLQILVGTKGKGTAEEEDGIEADARGGAIGCRGRGSGLRVALGLWVAVLFIALALGRICLSCLPGAGTYVCALHVRA